MNAPTIISLGCRMNIAESERIRARRAAWLGSLVGETLPVLAERDSTGYAPCYARAALPPATPAGEIVAVAVRGTMEGLLR